MCSHVHVSGRVNASIGALQTLYQYWKMVHTLYEFYTGYRFWRRHSGFAAPFCYPSSASSSFVSSEFASLLFLWEWHYVLPSLSSSDAITCLNCSDSSRPDHLTPLLIRFCAQSHTHQWISAPTYCPNYCWFVQTSSALKMFLYPLTQFTLRSKSVIYASEIWCSVQLSQCQQYCFNKSQFVESTHLPSVCYLLNVKNIIWAGFLGQTVQSYLCSFIGKCWKYYSGFFV